MQALKKLPIAVVRESKINDEDAYAGYSTKEEDMTKLKILWRLRPADIKNKNLTAFHYGRLPLQGYKLNKGE